MSKVGARNEGLGACSSSQHMGCGSNDSVGSWQASRLRARSILCHKCTFLQDCLLSYNWNTVSVDNRHRLKRKDCILLSKVSKSQSKMCGEERNAFRRLRSQRVSWHDSPQLHVLKKSSPERLRQWHGLVFDCKTHQRFADNRRNVCGTS